jgi:hypothetical protein
LTLPAALAGCKQTPQPRVQIKQQTVAVASHVPAIDAPQGGGPTPIDDCSGVDRYPLPRSYEQILADAPQESREPTTSLEAKAVIGPDGIITHLRFVRLSTLDAINKSAVEFVKRQHYKPAVLNGERVSVCSTISINVDLQ